MVSLRCKIVVKDALDNLGLHPIMIDMGIVEIAEELSESQREKLKKVLLFSGLELMDDKKIDAHRENKKRHYRNGSLFGRNA